jgi:hypothetical protein
MFLAVRIGRPNDFWTRRIDAVDVLLLATQSPALRDWIAQTNQIPRAGLILPAIPA